MAEYGRAVVLNCNELYIYGHWILNFQVCIAMCTERCERFGVRLSVLDYDSEDNNSNTVESDLCN